MSSKPSMWTVKVNRPVSPKIAPLPQKQVHVTNPPFFDLPLPFSAKPGLTTSKFEMTSLTKIQAIYKASSKIPMAFLVKMTCLNISTASTKCTLSALMSSCYLRLTCTGQRTPSKNLCQTTGRIYTDTPNKCLPAAPYPIRLHINQVELAQS